MRSSPSILHRVIRHPNVILASVKNHGSRVVTRPIRTISAIVITYAMVVLLVALSRDPRSDAGVPPGRSVAEGNALW
ncbi:hypothetical protein OB919_16260 [Halobacteria archaeon AArc-curdl1]|uniref:Uncharacterized protein n=1 Tax=Natronosalvus hydrolyticus TaxID=2979988 RepID=A0AAP3E8S0_9EURY|nr:hypothetical protein [Halobacteria archaeon AArc-curdl1]